MGLKKKKSTFPSIPWGRREGSKREGMIEEKVANSNI